MTTGRDHRRLDKIGKVLARKREEEQIRQHDRRQAAVRDLVAAAKALAGGPNDYRATWRPERRPEPPEDRPADGAIARPGAPAAPRTAAEIEAARREKAARERANLIRELRPRLKGYQLSSYEAMKLLDQYPELREEEPGPPMPPAPPPEPAMTIGPVGPHLEPSR